MTSNCRPTHSLVDGVYNSTQVRLYGLPGLGDNEATGDNQSLLTAFISALADQPSIQNKKDIGALWIKSEEDNSIMLISIGKKGPDSSVGIIFGYSFEGHCYDLPRPKIMVIPAKPEEIPGDDCGYDLKLASGYKVWIVDKLDRCVEFEMNAGFIEQVVLEANLPGKRSPSSYRATMAMAHRGGRLNE